MTSPVTTEYEYVVVGTGSAGSVVARRLVDSGVGRVLVIEAGPSDQGVPSLLRMPGWRSLWGGQYDWAYSTVPQAGLAGRVLPWPRGRVVGGSSSINGTIYVRGHPLVYDGWEADGAHGWGWDAVLPLFRRSERHHLGESRWHGADGPQPVSRVPRRTALTDAFLTAARDLGVPASPDLNGECQAGAGVVDTTTTADGERVSTARAFLWPVLDSPRLTLATGTRALRLAVGSGRCTGVEIAGPDGTVTTVRATREVVVCAGVVESPALLLRSGIGPGDQLRAHGIAQVLELPGVGANLHDQLIAPVVFGSPGPLPEHDGNAMDAVVFGTSRPGLRMPDLQPLLMHFARPADGYPVPEHGFAIGAGIGRPKSRGRLTLRSADPFDAPLLDPAYLTRRYDRDAMVAAVELAVALGEHPAFDGLRTSLVAPHPGRRSHEDVLEFVRRTALTFHHQVGTCRMGIDDDAVVDPELRVIGLDGLRVADASIMPAIPNGYTHAPTMMIGEKAAELVAGEKLVVTSGGSR